MSKIDNDIVDIEDDSSKPAGRTITATTKAWLTQSYGPEDLLLVPEEVMKRLFFYNSDMSSAGWTDVGIATITVELVEEKKLVDNKIEALKGELQSTLAAAEVAANKIRDQIQNLLALTYEPEEKRS